MSEDDGRDLIGKTLVNRYYVKRGIAVRRAGPVLAARDLDEDREVCLKILRRAHLADDSTLKRFEREARLISTLRHRNIVQFYGYGVTEAGDLYLAMELVPGQTLEHYLRRGPFSLDVSLYVMVDLLSALAEAHKLGVIHRDLKHSNVSLVAASGARPTAKLLDFGIAVLHRDAELVKEMTTASGITQTGAIVGTPGYMAPEILTSQPYDARADLYGVGVLWWEMLAGRRLFRGPPMPMLVKHITEPAPTLEEVGVEVPGAYDTLIHQLLEKSPEDRPESAAAVLEAIAALDFEQSLETETQVNALLLGETEVDAGSEVASNLGAPTTEVMDGFPRAHLLNDPVDG